MKAFAAFAMMAVAACAVDMQAENPYKDLFGSKNSSVKDSSSDDSGSGKTVEVDVWDTVDSELMELMTEISELLAIVETQGNSLMGTQMTFAMLMDEVSNLRNLNTGNSSDLATENATDEAQDKKLHKLDDKIEKYEGQVNKLSRDADLLKLRVGNLPSLEALNERLAEIVDMNAELKMMADTQAGTVAGIETNVSDRSDEVDLMTSDNVDFNMTLDAAVMKNEMTEDVIDVTTMQLSSEDVPLGLEPAIMSQMIVADYLEVNEDIIMLDDGINTLPSTFSLCPGETLDFHLALTNEAGTDANNMSSPSATNEFTAVTLLAGTTPVAISSTFDNVPENDGAVASYIHTLFYKFTNDSPTDSIDYSIEILAIGTTAADGLATIMP